MQELTLPGEIAGGANTDALGERRAETDRRSHSLRSFAYGSLRPRRRVGRRDGDDSRIFLDWHEPRVLYMALAILLMSCIDALLTLNILTAGGREVNGLMDWLIGNDVSWFLGVKIGVTGLGVSMLVVAVNRHLLGLVPVIRILHACCIGYALLISWELYLLAGLFPGLISSPPGTWAELLT